MAVLILLIIVIVLIGRGNSHDEIVIKNTAVHTMGSVMTMKRII